MTKANRMRWMMNWYPSYIGAGVRIERFSECFHEADVSMALTRWNRNYVGTHFGGSLYSMTDPFFMLMLMHNLGNRYVVWDQAAKIDFIRPGRGRVWARFRLSEEQIDSVRAQAADGKAIRPVFTVDVCDEQGELVARVEKTLYVRLKPAHRPASTPERQ